MASPLAAQLRALNQVHPSGSSGGGRSAEGTKATSILAGKLKKIRESGNSGAYRTAQARAQGEGGFLGVGDLLPDALMAVGTPLRAVVATGEGLGEAVTGRRGTGKSWGQKVTDPTYGFGTVIQRWMPDAPWVAKTGLGFLGDVALDPLTYATFGASPVLKGLGKSEGVTRFAVGAARYAEQVGRLSETAAGKAEAKAAARELIEVATTAGAGKSLSEPQLRAVERAANFMAEDGSARAIKPGSLGYGVGWHVPFRPDLNVMSPGSAGFGRGMEELGTKISRGVGAVSRDLLGGQLSLPRKLMRSGDDRLVELGVELINGTRRGKAAAAHTATWAGRETGDAVATLMDAHIPTDVLYDAMGERPNAAARARLREAVAAEGAGELVTAGVRKSKKLTGLTDEFKRIADDLTIPEAERGALLTDIREQVDALPKTKAASTLHADVGGPEWNRLAEMGPEVNDALHQLADFYDAVPHESIPLAAFGDTSRQFIADAGEGGRREAYVPRFGSDEFEAWQVEHRARKGLNQPVRPQPGEQSSFQKLSRKVGDKIGEGEEAIELVRPGSRDGIWKGTKEGAPSLERQTDHAVEVIYGPDAPQWYKRDFYDAHKKYTAMLSHQVNEQMVQNYLTAVGVARPTIRSLLANAEESAWREELFGGFDAVSGNRLSYSGKIVNNDEYRRLNFVLKSGDPAVEAVHQQWDVNPVDAIRNAEQRIKDVAKEQARYVKREKLTDELAAQFAEQTEHWQRAADLFKEYSLLNPNSKDAKLRLLDASRANMQATLVGHDVAWDRMTQDKQFIGRLAGILGTGHEGYGFAREAPTEVMDVLRAQAAMYDPISGDGLQGFIKNHYDPVNQWLKGMLTSTLGFLQRNIFGGSFNNWQAGVDVGRSTIGWGEILFSEGGKSWGDNAVYDVMDRLGINNSGYFTAEFGRERENRIFDIGRPGRPSTQYNFNPLAGTKGGERQFILPYLVHRLNTRRVEPLLRGTLAYDRLSKAVNAGRFKLLGIESMEDIATKITDQASAKAFSDAVMSSTLADDILADVAKYHFDYDDLNKFERQVMRRIVPFYTWTRKNVPLQLEMMFTQPGKTLGVYAAAKRNLEISSEEEDTVPAWFRQQGLIRMPFSLGGSRQYGTIELPFKDPFKAADVTGMAAGMLSPLIKAPIETWAGKQFFGDLPLRGQGDPRGLKPMNTAWLPLIPLLNIADKLPFSPLHGAVRGKDGQWYLAEEDNYLLGQYVPFLAQAQRQFGDKGKAKERLYSSWLSYLFGVQLRSNTPSDQEQETYRRISEVDATYNKLHATGWITTKAETA